MELLAITKVAKDYGISARMLRYYEQVGLIKSLRKNDYAYRVYDENALNNLKLIIILRKLRISVKEIIEIVNNDEARQITLVLQQNISRLDKEITALSTIKAILNRFVKEINDKTTINLATRLPFSEETLTVIGSLSFPDNQLKNVKDNLAMEKLNEADKKLSKLTDVRVIYLPPLIVAAVSAAGDNCEDKAIELLDNFVKKNNLHQIKPDIRYFGFDCSQGATAVGENSHKYQMWVTIPSHIDVPPPYVKRSFNGGLYAAHAIKMGDFDHWTLLNKWIEASAHYESDWQAIRCSPCEDDMDHCLEEHFSGQGDMQLDLLFPIKKKAIK
ncbi:MAG: effector binding domain-containing protein [Spirochaetaceae bacterium]|nr:effector binding domain-containing protein [Spirochaetaceae bacterium]